MVKHLWEPNAVYLVYFRRHTPLSEIDDFSIFLKNIFFPKLKNAFTILSNNETHGVSMMSGKVVVFDRISVILCLIGFWRKIGGTHHYKNSMVICHNIFFKIECYLPSKNFMVFVCYKKNLIKQSIWTQHCPWTYHRLKIAGTYHGKNHRKNLITHV